MPSPEPFLETGIVASPDGTQHTYMAYPGSLVRLPAGKLLAVYTSKTKPATRGMGSYSFDGGRTWDYEPIRGYPGDTEQGPFPGDLIAHHRIGRQRNPARSRKADGRA